MPAVPKRRHSKARRDRRRANIRLEKTELTKCENCGSVKVPHMLCSNCGFYKGRMVVKV